MSSVDKTFLFTITNPKSVFNSQIYFPNQKSEIRKKKIRPPTVSNQKPVG